MGVRALKSAFIFIQTASKMLLALCPCRPQTRLEGELADAAQAHQAALSTAEAEKVRGWRGAASALLLPASFLTLCAGRAEQEAQRCC